jgi:hypothetical protein
MSCTVIPPDLLKSARQHGVVVLAPLHCPCALTDRVFGPVHAAVLATIAHVAPRQHATVVIGHGLGWQIVPSPRNTLGLTHPVRVVTVHAPLAAQHAPVGWTHDTLAHAVEAPMNVPGQSVATVAAHVPSP